MLGPSRSFSGRLTLACCWSALSLACSAPSTFAVSAGGTSGAADVSPGSAGNVLDSAAVPPAEDGVAGAPQLESELDATQLPPGSHTANLFHELLGVSEADVEAKLELAVQRVFGLVGS